MDNELIEMVDRAESLAWDTLDNHLEDDMSDSECRHYLRQVAEIVQGRGSFPEKYALISDIFQKIVDGNTQKMIGHV